VTSIASATPVGRDAQDAQDSTKASNCSPPFYFDAQQIKRLKPECF
jgi:hypothetical protein